MRNLGLKRYTPADFGFPQYITDFCSTRRGGCQMPAVNIDGYGTDGFPSTFSGNVGTHGEILNLQGQLNVTHVRGNHTFRGGTDNRNHLRKIANMGNSSGVIRFTNDYTRAADDTVVYPAQDLGLSWAAFMLGIPTSFEIDDQVAPELQSPFLSLYAQDSWRVTQDLTLNVGLRYEYENGVAETDGRDIIGWDPDAVTAITPLAEAAYAANTAPELPASQFRVRGGPIFATDSGQNGGPWRGQSMWMPRISPAYSNR